MHIRYVMLWELKTNKNATETVKKMSSIYGQGVITDCQVRNLFRFGETSMRDEHRPGRPSDLDQDALSKLVGCKFKSSLELALDLNTSQSSSN